MAEPIRRGRKRPAREIDLVDDTAIQSIATDKEGDLSVSVEPPLKKTRKPSRKVVSDKPPVEGDCTICFENYKSDYAVLKCNHIYCFQCIKEWSETENSCPLCKGRFTSLDRYNVGEAEAEGKKVKKQRVKVGKKDQMQSYLRHMQNHGPIAQGVHQFTFFPVANSTIGRQFLLNLINSLHPNADFGDDDEDDDDWMPMPPLESEDEINYGMLNDGEDDEDDDVQIWTDFLGSGPGARIPARNEAFSQPVNLLDDDDEFGQLDGALGSGNNFESRNNSARRYEGRFPSIRQRMRPEVIDLTLDDNEDLVRTGTTSSSSSNNSSSVPNSLTDSEGLSQEARFGCNTR